MAHKNSHSAPRKKGGALKIVLVLLVLLLVVAGGGVWMAKREIDGGTPGEEVPVSIQQGSGVGTIANALKEAPVPLVCGQTGSRRKIAVRRVYACARQLLQRPDRGVVGVCQGRERPPDVPRGYHRHRHGPEDGGCRPLHG